MGCAECIGEDRRTTTWGHVAGVASLTLAFVERWGKTGEGLGEHGREEVGAVGEGDREEATAPGCGVPG